MQNSSVAGVTNDYVQCAGTSRDCKRTNEVVQQRRTSQGFKLPEKWCFRACRRLKDASKNRVSQVLKNNSTQTWEPWRSNTCVSKSKFDKSNHASITPDNERRLTPIGRPNDGYDRLSVLKNRSIDQASSATCKQEGCGICEAMRDRIFADMALQTDVIRYQIISCGSTRDQSVLVEGLYNFADKKNSAEVTPKTASSIKITTKTSRKTVSPVNKKTSGNSLAKKPVAKKPVSQGQTSKKTKKKVVTLSNLSPTKPPRGKKKNSTRKKTRTSGESDVRMVAATTEISVDIPEEKELAATKADPVEVNNELDPLRSIEEIKDRPDDELTVERDENVVKVRAVSSDRKTSIPNEVFEAKSSSGEKVSVDRSENDNVNGADVEPVPKGVFMCSSKCQGLLMGSDYVKLPLSSSSTSKKQYENGSTTSEKVEVKKKSRRTKKKLTLKTTKAHSSRSNSSECDDFYVTPTKKKKAEKSPPPKAKSKRNLSKVDKPIVNEIREEKSGVTNSEIVSTDESAGKSSTTIRVDETQSSPIPVNGQKSPRRESQSSVMMIWEWLRERYRFANRTATPSFAKAYSSLGTNHENMKDPFLSLFLPMTEIHK